jgi:hypothetical protein
MAHIPTPWVGLAALVAMFVLPYVPARLFEGPRTIKHHPRRHLCADCGAPWSRDHRCPAGPEDAYPPLRSELRRMAPTTDLERRPVPWLSG